VADRQSFFGELKRRKVLRVAVLYVGSVWAFGQGLSQFSPALGLPDLTTRWFLIAAAVLFPVALALSWAFDVRLHGIHRETEPDGRMPEAVAATPGPGAAAVEAPPEIPHKSIAVLPFVDLSPAHDQEYFSDGIAEEILDALVKLKGLKVAGRTSSFSFKGRNEDLRNIGKVLSVAHVLEGSVRKHGDRVRITAQLIQTCDGYHLWSEHYDGELSDIFDLQERIARAIARELDVLLHGDRRLVPVATTDPEAYALYLEATGIYNRRDVAHLDYAAGMLAKAVALDPNFARAYSRLAAVHALQSNSPGADMDIIVPTVMKEAAQASALDPGLGEPYSAIGLALNCAHRFIESRAALEKARQLQPEDASAWYWSGVLAFDLGHVALGCEWLDRCLALDPLYPAALLWRGIGYLEAGDFARAEGLFEKAHGVGLVHAGMGMHEITAAHGHPREAATQLARGMALLATGLSGETTEVLADGVYGGEKGHARALALIDGLVAARPASLPPAIPYTLLLMGETTRALDLGKRFRAPNDVLYYHRFWMPSMRALRESAEFQAFARDMGFVALWDRYGPPDGARRGAAGEYTWE
jgi:TolB-like protein